MAAELSSSCLISTKLPACPHAVAIVNSTSADTLALHYIEDTCSLESHTHLHLQRAPPEQQQQERTMEQPQEVSDSYGRPYLQDAAAANSAATPLMSDNFYNADAFLGRTPDVTTMNATSSSAMRAAGLLMLNVDEYESKSSSDNPDDCEHDVPGDGPPAKKRYHRHSQHQIQEMERVFKECPHPDEKQRLELSRELKLDPRQVKFWFQNKRTQVKAQHERHDNAYLRAENEKLRAENLALRDAIANVSCPNCGGPATLTDASFDEQQLRIENVRLREEIDRISKIAAKHVGRPISALNLGSTLASPSSTTNSTVHLPNETIVGNSSNAVDNETCNQSLLVINRKPIKLLDSEKPMIIEQARIALDELVQVSQAKDPLWTLVDPLNNLESINPEEYLARFGNINIINQNPNMRRETTRDTALIMMDAPALVDMFMNVGTWSDMFSSIVSTALLLEVLSTGTNNTPDGAMQLLYAEFQMPTPLVSTRESYFVRHCKCISSTPGMPIWAVVDASIDNIARVGFSPSCQARCRRRPSGCIIEEFPNGYSKVTWVEHFEIDEYRGVNHLFERLVSSGAAFGAQRWLSILNRRCESLHTINKTITTSSKDIVSPTQEGKKSLLKLVERMTNSFCKGVNASVAHTWITLSSGSSSTASASNDETLPHISLVAKGLGSGSFQCASKDDSYGVGDDVRVLIRKSVDDPGRPPGVVLCAATSIWLPIPPSHVFNFLKNQTCRMEWDILSNMGVVEEIMHVAKGHDDQNNVSLLRVNAESSNQPNMLILQECCAEETCYVVVYAPVDIAAMSSVINGGDPDCVALLPSGFSIFPDKPISTCHNGAQHVAAPPSPFCSPVGSILTVAFQILVDHVPTAKLSLGSVATVNNLISSTVLRIKNALMTRHN
ncbi:hypothetical protein KP509_38G046700 [Ceratopteris richardii]|uniref:Uncharacterized protein n=1 Tax=Ceratopteris richardii TaxID=49495 RepID=A0A8T2Q478_CERRI|nr:hypothetical protein KP509_38G046700 [Ceratopteris richardii]